MKRSVDIERNTNETQITIHLGIDGSGKADVSTGIGFFDHMLTLMCVHGFFDASITASGDLEVDAHHTVEDIGLVLGDAFDRALGGREGIRRYGNAVIPMDDALAAVTVDLAKRPYLVFHYPAGRLAAGVFDAGLATEFFRSLANRAGLNLHIQVPYGDNDHHIIEAVFKALGRALDQATRMDDRIAGIMTTKGTF